MHDHNNIFDLSYFNFYSYLSDVRRFQPARDFILVNTDDSTLPISVAEVLEHLKIEADHAEADAFYEGLIITATMVAEFLMRKEILPKQFRTYVPFFRSGIELRRAPLISVDSIEFWDENTESFVVVPPSTYYVTDTDKYAQIFLDDGKSWPSITTNRKQAVKIEFTVGLNNVVSDLSRDIKTALLNHISVLHEQRGDWGSADIGMQEFISATPSLSRMVYNKNRITNR